MRPIAVIGIVFAVVGLLFAVFTVNSAEFPLSAEDAAQVDKIAVKLATLSKVEGMVYQIDPQEVEKDDTKHIKGYPILNEKAVNEKSRDAFFKILGDKKSYNSFKAKCFEPGVALKISANGEETTVVLCLKCRWAHWFLGKERAYLSLTPEATKALLTLYFEQFPDTAKN